MSRKRRKRPKDTTKWPEFEQAVKDAGLTARNCTQWHWQIRGHKELVNVWPMGRDYYTIHVDKSSGSVTGNLEYALALAGRPPEPEPDATAPWEEAQSERQYGLVRTVAFWIWRTVW